MTAPARILEADMTRATKAVAKAGIERARIIFDLRKQTIEVIIGDSGDPPAAAEEWTDDD